MIAQIDEDRNLTATERNRWLHQRRNERCGESGLTCGYKPHLHQ